MDLKDGINPGYLVYIQLHHSRFCKQSVCCHAIEMGWNADTVFAFIGCTAGFN
ncbi:MAG: hypothetical protein ACI9B7_001011 [Oleispira sp.]|jgi:hypothetical protein